MKDKIYFDDDKKQVNKDFIKGIEVTIDNEELKNLMIRKESGFFKRSQSHNDGWDRGAIINLSEFNKTINENINNGTADKKISMVNDDGVYGGFNSKLYQKAIMSKIHFDNIQQILPVFVDKNGVEREIEITDFITMEDEKSDRNTWLDYVYGIETHLLDVKKDDIERQALSDNNNDKVIAKETFETGTVQYPISKVRRYSKYVEMSLFQIEKLKAYGADYEFINWIRRLTVKEKLLRFEHLVTHGLFNSNKFSVADPDSSGFCSNFVTKGSDYNMYYDDVQNKILPFSKQSNEFFLKKALPNMQKVLRGQGGGVGSRLMKGVKNWVSYEEYNALANSTIPMGELNNGTGSIWFPSMPISNASGQPTKLDLLLSHGRSINKNFEIVPCYGLSKGGQSNVEGYDNYIDILGDDSVSEVTFWGDATDFAAANVLDASVLVNGSFVDGLNGLESKNNFIENAPGNYESLVMSVYSDVMSPSYALHGKNFEKCFLVEFEG